jgi:multidrug efflux pump subunit AcrB
MCICIAFVPMFGLGGVAGYLFRPLAEAVVFAMIASYVLSRTLVPTMANYLLRKHVVDAGDAVHHNTEINPGSVPAKPSRNPLVRFHKGFERVFEAIRAHYRGLLDLCLHNRGKVIAGFFGFALLSLALAPFLGQDFFPSVDGGQIKIHVRAQTGIRIEERQSSATRSATRSTRSSRPISWPASSIISASASAASTWPTTTRARSASRTPIF